MTDATEKQVKYAKALGIDGAENMSKGILSKEIDRKIKENKDSMSKTLAKPKKTQPQASNGEFHLTPEQVRSNALACVIQNWEGLATKGIIERAKEFERYILDG